jgi:hypothetical protein
MFFCLDINVVYIIIYAHKNIHKDFEYRYHHFLETPMILSYAYVYICQNKALISSLLTVALRHKTPHKFSIELNN